MELNGHGMAGAINPYREKLPFVKNGVAARRLLLK
jgi:hypothetical protein